MYPLPRTVNRIFGSAVSSRSFSRKPGDVHVDGPGGDAAGRDPPDVGQQFLAGDGPAGVGRQIADQLGLALGKLRPVALGKADLAAHQVDRAAGDGNPRDVAGPLGAAAEHGLDPRQQLLDAERLDHVIVGPVARGRGPGRPLRRGRSGR